MKKIILFVSIVLSCSISQAQFSFNYGLGVFLSGGKAEKASGTGKLINYGVTVHPSFNLKEMEASSVSISAPVTLGVTGSVNSREGASENASFLLNAPLMIDYNSGAGSTSENMEGFGFFGGLGYGYHTGASVAFGSASGTGPVVNAGLRYGLSLWREEQVISLRFSFMKGMNTNKTDVFGINLVIR